MASTSAAQLDNGKFDYWISVGSAFDDGLTVSVFLGDGGILHQGHG